MSAFFVEQEELLGAALALLPPRPPPGALDELRGEIRDLRHYAVLNYIATVKAVKKRNRHLRVSGRGGGAGWVLVACASRGC